MRFVRRKIGESDVNPPNTRYNEECDCVETRASDTSPWVQDDAADPRHGTRYLLPPREGENVRCDAAEAMMQHFKAQVDAFLTAATILQFVNAVLTLAALFIPALGILAKLIFVIADALLTIGSSVIDAAMTEEVYDQIKCILFNNIGEDGQMSAAQLATIQTEIDTQIGGTPNIVFDLFTGLWGEVGWSNAGAVGEYVGDCDDCPAPWCRLYDFTISNYQFEPQGDEVTPLAVWTSGVGFESVAVDTPSAMYRICAIAAPFAADVTDMVATFEYTQGTCDAGGDAALDVSSQSFENRFITVLMCDVPVSPAEWCYHDDPGVPVTITQVLMQLISGLSTSHVDPGGVATLVSLKVQGVGAPPPEGVECEWVDCS